MNHFTILAEDLDATCSFYADFLGLEPGPRPPLGFPGAWLYPGKNRTDAILHIVCGQPLPVPEHRGGVLDHMAFTANGLAETVARLEQRGIAYRLGRIPNSGAWQLFFHDPNGAKVELDFGREEAAPAGWKQ
jgi:catechol 2,3-dioxygenase-like lactoylglutathione lyase family enzyme